MPNSANGPAPSLHEAASVIRRQVAASMHSARSLQQSFGSCKYWHYAHAVYCAELLSPLRQSDARSHVATGEPLGYIFCNKLLQRRDLAGCLNLERDLGRAPQDVCACVCKTLHAACAFRILFPCVLICAPLWLSFCRQYFWLLNWVSPHHAIHTIEEWFSFGIIWEGPAQGTARKECLNVLTEVSHELSMRIFCQIKIIYLKGVDLHNNAFHKIWQLSLLLSSPCPAPLLSSLTRPPPPSSHSFVVGRFFLCNLKSKYSEYWIPMGFSHEYHRTCW